MQYIPAELAARPEGVRLHRSLPPGSWMNSGSSPETPNQSLAYACVATGSFSDGVDSVSVSAGSFSSPAQPGMPGGQSLLSPHAFGAGLPGRCGASLAMSSRMGTVYGCLGSPELATGSPPSSKPWIQ